MKSRPNNSTITSSKKSVFISVGEQSGDLIGAQMLEMISNSTEFQKTPLNFFGVLGSQLQAQGAKSIADMNQFSSFGVTDVLKKLPLLKMQIQALKQEVLRHKPVCAILIDAPGLHFELAEYLWLHQIPVYQIVAPKLWAWGEGRTWKLKKYFKKVFGILPFEESFFKERGVSYQYVGNPLVERVLEVVSRQSTSSEKEYTIAVLPGSRKSEWNYFFSFF